MKKNNIAQCVGPKIHRIFIAKCALAAALIFTGASVWEGSAMVSVSGELPEGAYSVATNSFPNNTVVDVTNLENGRTIRVIVTAGLDSPGLLAMLSQNAAASIGIPNQGIGRIRMKESSDPTAYSHFADEPSSAGAGGAALDKPETVSSTAAAGDLAGATPEDSFYSSVINQPETYTPEPVDYPADGAVRVEPQPNWVPGQEESAQGIEELPYPASPQDTQTAPAAMPFYIPDTQAAQAPVPASPPPYAPAAPAPQAAVTPPLPSSIIILVPAEERPPEGSVRIPPGTIIGPIPLHQLPWVSGGDSTMNPQSFISPIGPNQQSAAVPRLTAPQATVSPAPPQAPNGLTFSVPMVTQLEKGKHYVQIGAFTRPDVLETAAARFNRNYPMTVQTGASPSSIIYRLLVGPLNAGESGAVLQQVKNSGYPDAFVRNGS
jgi:hypothetical protein